MACCDTRKGGSPCIPRTPFVPPFDRTPQSTMQGEHPRHVGVRSASNASNTSLHVPPALVGPPGVQEACTGDVRPYGDRHWLQAKAAFSRAISRSSMAHLLCYISSALLAFHSPMLRWPRSQLPPPKPERRVSNGCASSLSLPLCSVASPRHRQRSAGR